MSAATFVDLEVLGILLYDTTKCRCGAVHVAAEWHKNEVDSSTQSFAG